MNASEYPQEPPITCDRCGAGLNQPDEPHNIHRAKCLANGGPAFPQPISASQLGGVEYSDTPGMTLRDWFAGQALIGLLAHGLANKEQIAGHAYDYADAMLAERAKGGAA